MRIVAAMRTFRQSFRSMFDISLVTKQCLANLPSSHCDYEVADTRAPANETSPFGLVFRANERSQSGFFCLLFLPLHTMDTSCQAQKTPIYQSTVPMGYMPRKMSGGGPFSPIFPRA